jgi:hypothetical protein
MRLGSESQRFLVWDWLHLALDPGMIGHRRRSRPARGGIGGPLPRLGNGRSGRLDEVRAGPLGRWMLAGQLGFTVHALLAELMRLGGLADQFLAAGDVQPLVAEGCVRAGLGGELRDRPGMGRGSPGAAFVRGQAKLLGIVPLFFPCSGGPGDLY